MTEEKTKQDRADISKEQALVIENTPEMQALAIEDKPETAKKPKAEDKDQNIVFIGQKPFMNYVTAVVTQFKTKKEKEVIIKARGKFISRAVDVAEVSAKRFLKEESIKVKNIKIDSEEFENKEGKRVNVSTIDITLEKA